MPPQSASGAGGRRHCSPAPPLVRSAESDDGTGRDEPRGVQTIQAGIRLAHNTADDVALAELAANLAVAGQAVRSPVAMALALHTAGWTSHTGL